jgi:16S rRNA (cytidine1402-2'-O)-methyltransferase
MTNSFGTLYIVATPIGNLEDITLRALRILKEVDEIACEDTRHTRKLLSHFEISKPLVSYFQHNQRARSPQILEKLKSGANIALVSDAGTPGISDPGAFLVEQAIQEGVSVVPIPGVSAVISSLCAAGLPTDRFYFHGFLPLKPGKRRGVLKNLKTTAATLAFYESGRRLTGLFKDLVEVYGEKAKGVIARELTKIYEEFLRGSLRELADQIPHEGLKGECVVLVDVRETEPISSE